MGQIALSESIKYAPIFLTAPIDYSHLIWSTLFGFLIWGFWPGPLHLDRRTDYYRVGAVCGPEVGEEEVGGVGSLGL